jgi:hypothetical protein
MARPRELSLGAAAGTASRDCTPAAAAPPRFWCLRACGGARKALRLPREPLIVYAITICQHG